MSNRSHRFAIPLIAALLAAPAGRGEDKDYTGKELPEAKFVSDLLNRAKFDRANLEAADFSYATLKNARSKGRIWNAPDSAMPFWKGRTSAVPN